MIDGGKAFFEAEGYTHVRQLPTGEWAGLQRMMFTTGLIAGLDRYGYRTRFCYETAPEAERALAEWNGEGWPPGYWVKQKPQDVANPLRTAKSIP